MHDSTAGRNTSEHKWILRFHSIKCVYLYKWVHHKGENITEALVGSGASERNVTYVVIWTIY